MYGYNEASSSRDEATGYANGDNGFGIIISRDGQSTRSSNALSNRNKR